MKSVVEYFRETYDFTLRQTQWPCLQVGNQQRPNYLPMEVCALLFAFSVFKMEIYLFKFFLGLQDCRGTKIFKKVE